MLTSNTIRFTTDIFGQAVPFVDEPIDGQPVDPDAPDVTPAELAFNKTALLVAKKPLDCSKVSAVNQFLITGSQPSGSKRRLVFLIDDLLYYFKSGNLILWERELTVDNVLAYGNKASTLATFQNIAGFVGKKIYPIIALSSPSDADEFPSIKLALATTTSNQQLVDTFDSPIYELGDTQTIINVEAQTQITGQAELEITCRLRLNDEWSSYMTFADAVDRQADAIQFKSKATVADASGSHSAQINSIVVTHTSGQAVVTGNLANLFSVVQSYEADLQTAYCLVRHDPLVDAKIECYVNFMNEPKHRHLKNFGTGNGSRQELSLGDNDIVPSSLKIYQDDEEIFDFDFSSELSTVILTAKKNSVLYASYDYGHGKENWRKMTQDDVQPYNDDDGTYSTRFTYKLSDEQSIGMKVANVRVRLERLTGSASESLGKATGKTQLFTLKHRPKVSTINFTEAVTFSYDDASGILSCVAPKNKALNVSYNWQGLSPVVHSFAAGFSVC